MVAAERIAGVLGIDHKIHSLHALAKLVAKGLPKASVRAVAERVFRTPIEQRELMQHLVPVATYKRRKGSLKPEESERAERVARVIATAEFVWNDREDAREFLLKPHPLLDNQRPIDAALTELGARQAEEVMWQLFYGLPT
ncbi:MAG: antitoxin Xre-like helix-turn-helix domain-containing protein [Sulfuricaulis sp.]